MQKIIFAIGAVVVLSTTRWRNKDRSGRSVPLILGRRVETWRRAGSGPALTRI